MQTKRVSANDKRYDSLVAECEMSCSANSAKAIFIYVIINLLLLFSINEGVNSLSVQN